MWWNHTGWGPMHGWWFMPFFGMLCMGIFLYFLFRVFNREGGSGCQFAHRGPQNNQQRDDLLNEIKVLRSEVDKLNKKLENHST